MAVSSSSISQAPSRTLPCSCGCCRCGDVIAACNLEPRPSSCDPSLQQTVPDWHFRRAEDALGMVWVGQESEGSRRKSEESLHRLWESIDLSEPDRPVWWPFLPKWVKDDVVLCQIARLPGPPQAEQETVSAMWDRLGREFEEREKFHPKSSHATSRSSFTSFEDDCPHFDALKAPTDRASSEQALTTKRVLKHNDFPPHAQAVSPDPSDDFHRPFVNSVAERAQRQKRKLQELGRRSNPYTVPCHQGDSSGSSSPKVDNIDQGIIIMANSADPSSFPPSKLSPRMTPSSFPEPTDCGEEEKLSFTTAHMIKIEEPTLKLARLVPSPHSKPTSASLVKCHSRYSLATSISSPGREEQFFYAGATKVDELERQTHPPLLDYTTVGKRKRAVPCPSLPDSPSPNDNGLIWSKQLRKCMRAR